MNARLDGISVLHVDDDPDFAETAADVLERQDNRFEFAVIRVVECAPNCRRSRVTARRRGGEPARKLGV